MTVIAQFFGSTLALLRVASFVTFCFLSTGYTHADSYSKFGSLRANISNYLTDYKWLVYFDINLGPRVSEVVGFDEQGNIFILRGIVRPDAEDMLDMESYEAPSITFSTEEGFLYSWRGMDDENPFEIFISLAEYDRLIEKFEFYPFLKDSEQGPLVFKLLKKDLR